jgi:hypothetical protein
VSSPGQLMTADSGSLPNAPGQPAWGIYLGGAPVITADTTVSLEWSKDWTVSDFPVETGAFQSYDKVELPFTAKLRFAAGGSVSDRQEFLSSVSAIAPLVTLYQLAMPEVGFYPSVVVHHYGFDRRNDSGLGLLIVDVYVTEVRATATAAFTNTANPGSANPVGGGNPQGIAATQQEQSVFNTNLDNINANQGFNQGADSFNGGAGW